MASHNTSFAIAFNFAPAILNLSHIHYWECGFAGWIIFSVLFSYFMYGSWQNYWLILSFLLVVLMLLVCGKSLPGCWQEGSGPVCQYPRSSCHSGWVWCDWIGLWCFGVCAAQSLRSPLSLRAPYPWPWVPWIEAEDLHTRIDVREGFHSIRQWYLVCSCY